MAVERAGGCRGLCAHSPTHGPDDGCVGRCCWYPARSSWLGERGALASLSVCVGVMTSSGVGRSCCFSWGRARWALWVET